MLRALYFWLEQGDRGMSIAQRLTSARSALTPEYTWRWDKPKKGRGAKKGERKFSGPIHFLGQVLIVEDDEAFADFLDRFSSLFWLTYRRDFPRIAPTDYTSDSGWGCMLRTGQMMLALAFRRHFFGRSWRRSQLRGNPRQYQKYHDILTWFNDSPSSRCFYSVHKMTQEGSHLDKRAGEWYGPNAVAQIIKRCARVHRQGGQGPLSVVVTDDGVIYTDEVEAACAAARRTDPGFKTDPARPGAAAGGAGPGGAGPGGAGPGWTTGALIIVPVTLGWQKLNRDYCPALLRTLQLKQTLGFVGGRPCHSLFFVGAQASNLFFLDPHTTQDALDLTEIRTAPQRVARHRSTFHCSTPKVMDVRLIDPSLAMGFYCRDARDLAELAESINVLAEAMPMAVVRAAKTRPDYASLDARAGDGTVRGGSGPGGRARSRSFAGDDAGPLPSPVAGRNGGAERAARVSWDTSAGSAAEAGLPGSAEAGGLWEGSAAWAQGLAGAMASAAENARSLAADALAAPPRGGDPTRASEARASAARASEARAGAGATGPPLPPSSGIRGRADSIDSEWELM
jgi:cysteine protease ATG4